MRRPQFLITAFFSLIILGMLFISLSEGDSYAYSTELISLIILWIPPFLAWRQIIDLPWPAILFMGITLFLHSLGLVTLWYYSTFWWDKLTHFATGILVASLVAMGLLIILKYSKTIRIPNKWLAFFVFVAVLASEVFWEVFEFAMDSAVGTNMQHSLVDTINDILSNVVTGIIAGVGAAYFIRHDSLDSFIRGLNVERTVKRLRSRLIKENDIPKS